MPTKRSSTDRVSYTWQRATPTAFARYLGDLKRRERKCSIIGLVPFLALSRTSFGCIRALSGEWILPDSQGVAPFQTRSM